MFLNGVTCDSEHTRTTGAPHHHCLLCNTLLTRRLSALAGATGEQRSARASSAILLRFALHDRNKRGWRSLAAPQQHVACKQHCGALWAEGRTLFARRSP